jgi:hypothetical protein
VIEPDEQERRPEHRERDAIPTDLVRPQSQNQQRRDRPITVRRQPDGCTRQRYADGQQIAEPADPDQRLDPAGIRAGGEHQHHRQPRKADDGPPDPVPHQRRDYRPTGQTTPHRQPEPPRDPPALRNPRPSQNPRQRSREQRRLPRPHHQPRGQQHPEIRRDQLPETTGSGQHPADQYDGARPPAIGQPAGERPPASRRQERDPHRRPTGQRTPAELLRHIRRQRLQRSPERQIPTEHRSPQPPHRNNHHGGDDTARSYLDGTAIRWG